MLGLESMWALTREAIMLTGDTVAAASWMTLGLEGSRPLLPFKLSVLTTARRMKSAVTLCPVWALIWNSFNFNTNPTPLTFSHHADSKALLETAELAAIAPPLVHGTVLVREANVLGIFLDCTL